MTLLQDYDARTAWKYQPLSGRFFTHPGLENKVNGDGSFRPFPGSTAVFRLDGHGAGLARMMQGMVHRALGESGMLARPLPPDSFHVTLHDLINPEDDGETGGEYAARVERSLRDARQAAEACKEEWGERILSLRPDRIVNMMSKSLVLLLRPDTEEDFAALLSMYRRLDGIVPLPYPFTPHITLAYFRPGPLDGDALEAALKPLQPREDEPFRFALSARALTAQRFAHMAAYTDVPETVCFCCDGGLNRSVMAARIVNHLARERGLPLVAKARSAYEDTQGAPIPEEVWRTLERHNIPADKGTGQARFLRPEDACAFTRFAAISRGAADRLAFLHIPRERWEELTELFYGVADPAFEGDYEEAFQDLFRRAQEAMGRIQPSARRYV